MKDDVINLVVSSTGAGKSYLALSLVENYDVAAVVPFISIIEQHSYAFPKYEVKVGTKSFDNLTSNSSRITSFHSIPRMLELENIDILIIDEIHMLTSYASFTRGMLSTFWKTIESLKEKHPHMKIMALTGTPQFIMFANFLDFNIITIEPRIITAKPETIYVSRSWRNMLKKLDSYLYLYPNRKLGAQQAKKYKGLYIDASLKDGKIFKSIMEGKMPHKKVFTSTLLSNGISILDKNINAVITNWNGLTECVQMSARLRNAKFNLYSTVTIPYFMRHGLNPVKLDWTNDFETNMKLLSQYEQYYSWAVHTAGEEVLHHVLYTMIWAPSKQLEPVEYFI